MTSDQVTVVAALLKGAPKIDGKVIVEWERTADENERLAQHLYSALQQAEIDSSIVSHGKTVTAHVDYPGLSILYSRASNLDLLNAIEQALLKAKVISQPLMPKDPKDRDMKDAYSPDLELIVRDPG
jgi:hypothetical protein